MAAREVAAATGWDFRVETWAWEDDDYLVAAVVRRHGDGGGTMVRCSALPARCVLISAP